MLERLFRRRRRLVRSDRQTGQSRTLFSQPVIPESPCFRRSSTGSRILRLAFVDHFLAAGEPILRSVVALIPSRDRLTQVSPHYINRCELPAKNLIKTLP